MKILDTKTQDVIVKSKKNKMPGKLKHDLLELK